jgi:transportin-1
MNLTNNDLSGMENTFKQSSQYVSKIENFLTVVEDFKQPDEFISESYNPNTTLRKLCARTLDKLSVLFPSDVFQIVKDSLERDMKNHDWIIREKSILALGAISKGSYEYLKQHLSNLCQFLITELQNPNKPVRAISCWTVSRYNFLTKIF